MTDEFRIIVMGQEAFGASVLSALVKRGETIIGAFCPPDSNERPDPLKTMAQKYAVPMFQFKRMRSQAAIDAFTHLASDLCVMAFVTDIVPTEILEAPTRGTIQYHPSLLPAHRGPSAINWAIIQGDRTTGLTIFWPEAGIDTGPILLQKEVEIGPDDTVGSLYFEKLFPLGVDAMVEAVEMVKAGTAPKIPQDESQATYEGRCKAEDVVIDWSAPVGDIYNLIRGSDPTPGANTTLGNARVHFYRATKQDGDTGRPAGEVVAITDAGFVVAAKGGSILIGRVQPAGRDKLAASEWVESVGLRPGMRFGRPDRAYAAA